MGAILVYDVTKRVTFENVSKWLSDIKMNSDQKIVIMLVGNKTDITDLHPEKREVSTDEGCEFAKENQLMFMETPALSNYRINEAFEDLLKGRFNFNCRNL